MNRMPFTRSSNNPAALMISFACYLRAAIRFAKSPATEFVSRLGPEPGSRIGQAAALDGEHLDRRLPPAQRRWPQRFDNNVTARTHEAQEIGGYKQSTADLLAML